MPRLFLDITTLLRSSGHADGITRTVWNLASYALDHLPDATFVYLGGAAPLAVDRHYLRRLLDGEVRIDTSHFPDPARGDRLRDRLPSGLRTALLWAQKPRRQALLLVERVALQSGTLAAIGDRLRPWLLNDKYRRMLTGPGGRTCRLVPHDLALHDMSALSRDDTLVLIGSDWQLMARALERSAIRPRVTALCYDIIPLLFPHFFSDAYVNVFRGCVETVFARADLVVFTARQIAADTERYWIDRKLPLPRTTVVPLGSDPPREGGLRPALPAPLAAGQFALFVSTIEPRKGHRMLFEVWKALLDEGIPQQCNFKLVFVGRKGWMVDALLQEMAAHPSFGHSLLLLTDIDDATLATLYDACAFTLYPSLYEGFGLPVIESFGHGKPVIASSAGALFETVAGLSPCLSPHDETVWRTTLKQWITDPSVVRRSQQRIATDYRPRSWTSASEAFFSAVKGRPDSAVAGS